VQGDLHVAAVDRQHVAVVGEALLADHARWNSLSSRVAGYLRAMNLNPADNSRGEHQLATVMRDLKRALAGDIDSPAPHWSARAAVLAEQANRIELRREREREEVA
jgi:hypothetical protein